jgi:hypothetical protein
MKDYVLSRREHGVQPRYVYCGRFCFGARVAFAQRTEVAAMHYVHRHDHHPHFTGGW